MMNKIIRYSIILSLLLPSFNTIADVKSPIPPSSLQMIVVLTDSLTATTGTLFYFERDCTLSEWALAGDEIPVVLGRKGLGWGIGLHDMQSVPNFPTKKEGDGRSPAGVFWLSAVFGYESADHIPDLKMPYIHVTDLIECIDDAHSRYYNHIISRAEAENIDWDSSEKMSRAGIYYELGVVVEHNRNPVTKGAGSCIFLHNWKTPNETSAGCTEMSPANMKEIVYWLDQSKNPILVQLTKQLYCDLREQWELPEIFVDANRK